jgi:hypothetical protein
MTTPRCGKLGYYSILYPDKWPMHREVSQCLVGMLMVSFVSIRLVSSIELHTRMTMLYSEGKQGCPEREGGCLQLILAWTITGMLVSALEYEVCQSKRDSSFNLRSLGKLVLACFFNECVHVSSTTKNNPILRKTICKKKSYFR